MKKFIPFLIFSLALFFAASCSQSFLPGSGSVKKEKPVSDSIVADVEISDQADADESKKNDVESKTSGVISLKLPSAPSSYLQAGIQTREAGSSLSSGISMDFDLTLSSSDVHDFRPVRKTAKSGELIKFEKLPAGTYIISAVARNDDYKLIFSAYKDSIVISDGKNTNVQLPFMMLKETEHLKLVPSETGVTVTLRGIDMEGLSYLTLFQTSRPSEEVSPDFCFEFDDQTIQNALGDDGSYSFLWPFRPVQIDGKDRYYYSFKLQAVGTDGVLVNLGEACCEYMGCTYWLDMEDYDALEWNYEEDGMKRLISLKDVSYAKMKDIIPTEGYLSIPQSKIDSVKALVQLWAGNFKTAGACKWEDEFRADLTDIADQDALNAAERMGFFKDLLNGNKVDILSADYPGSSSKGNLNKDFGEYGKITPTLIWEIYMTDYPYGKFQLPRIKECFSYTPVVEKAEDGILSGAKSGGNICLTVAVPEDTAYMEIVETDTWTSFEFTAKDSNGKLSCSGSTVTIPWAFQNASDSYIPFKICYAYGADYQYKEHEILVYGAGENGSDFAMNPISGHGQPEVNGEIDISSSSFKVSMPYGMKLSDYTLNLSGTSYTIADSCIVYTLCCMDSATNMDLRFRMTGDIPDETYQVFDSTVKYDVTASDSIYWCNNDENGSKTSWYVSAEDSWDHQPGGFWTIMNLKNNPQFRSEGDISFRLKDLNGKYIDSGNENFWLGEYRSPVWSSDFHEVTAYPPAEQTARATAGTKVGISMPTQYLQRWNKDGDNMKNLLEADGYTVDLEFAGDSELNLQIEQIKDMVDGGCDVLIVAAVDGWNLSDCLAVAKNKGVKVIAYDRLISNTDAVSYYTTFNNWNVGVLQGEYIESALKLKTASGPFYMEFFTGDKGDANVTQFFGGAMSVLEPYLNSGKLICLSRQTTIEACETPSWSSDNAQSRMEDLIVANGYAPAGQKLDAVLCSNDSTAQGVIAALKEVGYTADNMPFVTGQDCDMPSVKMILKGEQSMSVFKDTRILAAKAVEMAESILKGNGVLVNDVSSYYNGTGCIPTLLVDSAYCDISNYQQLLLDSGYYSAESLLENYVTLNVLSYGYEGDAFEDICNEFRKENPFIILKYEQYYDEDYHDQVAYHINSGKIPDIAYMGADARWGEAWQEAGLQVDNTNYIPENIDESLIPDFFGTGVKPYIPDGGINFCSVVGVNMKLLEQIGGKLPTTYDEFKELAQLCNENGIKCLSTHGADAWVWGSCVMSGIIPRTTGNPAWIENAVNSNASFTDDDFVAALKVLAQWVADDILDPDSVNTDDWTGKANFANGEYLMYIDGQWGFSQKNYGDLAENITLIPIPQVPGEKYCKQSVASAWQPGYGITSAGASNQDVLEAAKKWLKCYHSYDATVQRMENGAISSPILKDFTVTDDMDPFVDDKLDLNKYSSCEVIDSWLTGTANDTLNEGMQEIVAGTMSASEVATAVQSAFEAQNQ